MLTDERIGFSRIGNRLKTSFKHNQKFWIAERSGDGGAFT